MTEMRQFVQRDLRDLQNQSKAIAIHIGASEAIQAAKVGTRQALGNNTVQWSSHDSKGNVYCRALSIVTCD